MSDFWATDPRHNVPVCLCFCHPDKEYCRLGYFRPGKIAETSHRGGGVKSDFREHLYRQDKGELQNECQMTNHKTTKRNLCKNIFLVDIGLIMVRRSSTRWQRKTQHIFTTIRLWPRHVHPYNKKKVVINLHIHGQNTKSKRMYRQLVTIKRIRITAQAYVQWRNFYTPEGHFFNSDSFLFLPKIPHRDHAWNSLQLIVSHGPDLIKINHSQFTREEKLKILRNILLNLKSNPHVDPITGCSWPGWQKIL